MHSLGWIRINGVYGFDFFSKKPGFQEYYGMTEYNNASHYDGAWGIWDDKFLQYSLDKINQIKPPFIAGIFTLSSHHPFKLPKDYINQKNGYDEKSIQSSIRYTDYSLRKFFQEAKKTGWFENTLFIITADHTANVESHTAKYSTLPGIFRIPLIFYSPSEKIISEIGQDVVQQIDIVPSIIDWLNIDAKIESLGNSVFSKKANRVCVNIHDSGYAVMDSTFLCLTDVNSSTKIYNYLIDESLRQDISGTQLNQLSKFNKHLKSTIQFHNKKMNENIK